MGDQRLHGIVTVDIDEAVEHCDDRMEMWCAPHRVERRVIGPWEAT